MSPKTITELKSYLGWQWSNEEEKAFQKSKDLLTSDQVLTHYDPTLPLTLACDASAYGIGIVLTPRMPVIYSPLL